MASIVEVDAGEQTSGRCRGLRSRFSQLFRSARVASFILNDNNSPKIWHISNSGNHVEENEATADQNSDIERSDNPDFLHMLTVPMEILSLAKEGNVKQLATLCNANPDRLQARDRKGATILHHAAAAQQVEVMDFILKCPGGAELLFSIDNFQATPLHWAVERDSSESVDFLLQRGADPHLGNNTGHGALHLAVQKNSLRALRVLLQHKVNTNTKGNAGLSPLHIAAMTDNAEAFRILLDAGAKPCQPCSQGYRPLHRAAFSGSKNVMHLLLNRCTMYGYTTDQLLSFGDKEKSSPLHIAATGGNLETIKLCLEYGAKLDVKQGDSSTPMHMICGQGNLEIVKVMFNKAPEQARACLFLLDKRDHTPLHKAAMFNHPATINYLMEEKADIEVLDVDQQTPLLLAARRGCWGAVRTLIDLGANYLAKDKDERNIMHIIVLRGGDISNLSATTSRDMESMCKSLLQKDDVRSLLSKPDAFGCNPLHYACQEGNLASLKTLMQIGVNTRLKSWKNQSALHFASMNGRFNACSRLLDSDQGPNIINEKDEEGMTPLHFAAMNGHFKVVQLLTTKGALIHKNTKGETSLHLAAFNGYTKTIRTLIEVHCQLTDQIEENGNTALHHAARAGHTSAVQLLMDMKAAFLRNDEGNTCFTETILSHNHEVALAIVQHDRWEEALQQFQKIGDTIQPPVLLLIQHLPDVCMAMLDRCKEHSEDDTRSTDYWIRYHFKFLQPPVEIREKFKQQLRDMRKDIRSTSGKEKKEKTEKLKKTLQNFPPVTLPALNKMVEFNRVKCLRHPVSTAYLQYKWESYGRILHLFNVLFYLMGLFPITYIVSTVNSRPHWENYGDHISVINGTIVVSPPVQYSAFQIAMMIQLIVISSLHIIKEVVQIFQQRLAYLSDVNNLLVWVLSITSVLYVYPFLGGYPIHWQFEMGAVAIFLAWYNLLIFLQKLGEVGIYVVMFLQILRTLVRVLLVFSFLIVAFALSFTVLMQNEADKSFSNPGLSIMRVISMLLGEIAYVDKFLTPYVDGNPETNHFAILTFLFLIAFALMVPILLMNLLIGLAVGDIAEIQSNAVLQRIAMQVRLHTAIESRLPSYILKRIEKKYVTVYPNRCKGILRTIWYKVFQSNEMKADNAEDKNNHDPHMEFLQSQVSKQKQRMKQMQTSLDKQHDLLRLIVQKMEISSEADYQDEGSVATMEGQDKQKISALPASARAKLLALKAIKSNNQ